MVTPSECYLWRCTQCHFQTEIFGDFMSHPCQMRQLEQQRQAERTIKRVHLDDFLFCPVCGNSRLKRHEEQLRAGRFGLMPRDHCLLCWTSFDQDWSFLNQFYCFRSDYVLALRCPTPDCSGDVHIARDDFRPTLEWTFVRRKPYPRLARKKVALRCRHCGKTAQAHHLLPANRVNILAAVTTWLRFYEMEGLGRLRRVAPSDPRVSQQALEQWEAIWAQRIERLEQEAAQEASRQNKARSE